MTVFVIQSFLQRTSSSSDLVYGFHALELLRRQMNAFRPSDPGHRTHCWYMILCRAEQMDAGTDSCKYEHSVSIQLTLNVAESNPVLP